MRKHMHYTEISLYLQEARIRKLEMILQIPSYSKQTKDEENCILASGYPRTYAECKLATFVSLQF